MDRPQISTIRIAFGCQPPPVTVTEPPVPACALDSFTVGLSAACADPPPKGAASTTTRASTAVSTLAEYEDERMVKVERIVEVEDERMVEVE